MQSSPKPPAPRDVIGEPPPETKGTEPHSRAKKQSAEANDGGEGVLSGEPRETEGIRDPKPDSKKS